MGRLIAAAALFVLCAGVGELGAERFRQRLSAIAGIASDMSKLESILRCERREIAYVAAELAENGALRQFWSMIGNSLEQGTSFAAAWKQAEMMLAIDREERAALAAFASEFGKNDAETELSRLHALNERLAACEKKLRAETANKMKLARTISLLLALALALLVI